MGVKNKKIINEFSVEDNDLNVILKKSVYYSDYSVVNFQKNELIINGGTDMNKKPDQYQLTFTLDNNKIKCEVEKLKKMKEIHY